MGKTIQKRKVKLSISDIPEELRDKTVAWQVIISVTSKHEVGVGGTMCAEKRIGSNDCKPFGVLPGKVNAVDFRSDVQIIRVFANDGGLICTHNKKHTFVFDLAFPENGKIYYGVIPA
jgi:hypothetical protein